MQFPSVTVSIHWQSRLQHHFWILSNCQYPLTVQVQVQVQSPYPRLKHYCQCPLTVSLLQQRLLFHWSVFSAPWQEHYSLSVSCPHPGPDTTVPPLSLSPPAECTGSLVVSSLIQYILCILVSVCELYSLSLKVSLTPPMCVCLKLTLPH